MVKIKSFNPKKTVSLLTSAGNVKDIANKILKTEGRMSFKIDSIEKTDNPFERVIILQSYYDDRPNKSFSIILGEKFVKDFCSALENKTAAIVYYHLMVVLEKINSPIRGQTWEIIKGIPEDNATDDAVESLISNSFSGSINNENGYIVSEEEYDPYGENAPVINTDEDEEALMLEAEPGEGQYGYNPGRYVLESRITNRVLKDLGYHESPQAARNAAREEGYGFPGIWRVSKQ